MPSPEPMEPARETSIGTLGTAFAGPLMQLLRWMEAQDPRKYGGSQPPPRFDPEIFEARRLKVRQRWLYGVGRTHSLGRKPVTWTLESLHLAWKDGLGYAADITSRRYKWSWPAFFKALRLGAPKFGLECIPQEGCHVQFPRSRLKRLVKRGLAWVLPDKLQLACIKVPELDTTEDVA